MIKEKFRLRLSIFVPDNSVEMLMDWIFQRPLNLRISKSRRTKLGDFKVNAQANSIPQISVNGDLNSYEFLFTLLHEFAHLEVYEQYGFAVKSHGKEWKTAYQHIIQPYIEKNIFPEPLKSIIIRHMQNPKASSYADLALCKAFLSYSEDVGKDQLFLEELAEGTLFEINGKLLVKGIKRRTRYLCADKSGRRKYTVSSLAIVCPFS